ncbi:MAG: dolichyl-phosphate beta-glucosyltransferase [Pseudomonadota bacterium]
MMPRSQLPTLSIIVPAFNEAERLGPSLLRIIEFVHQRSLENAVECIVVDDGSTDATAAVAARHALEHDWIRCLSYKPNRGKGYAVRMGMLAALGERRLFSDADLSTPIEDLDVLTARLDAGADVAIGSRALPDSMLGRRQPWHREMMGRTFNLIIRAAGLARIRDTQCGFKLFTAQAAQELFASATVDGFAFDVEILLLAEGCFRVDEVPVHWEHRDASRVSLGLDSARMLLEVLTVRARRSLRRTRRSGPRA